MEFCSFVLCLRRQLYLEIKEQVHEIDERSKEQVKKKKKEMFFVYFFSYFHAFFILLLLLLFFGGRGVGEDFGKFRAVYFNSLQTPLL